MRRSSWLLIILGGALAVAAACSGGGSFSAENYLQSLPGWPSPAPNANVPTAPSSTGFVTGADGNSYRCSFTPYSLTSTPDKITTFDPNVDVLWPGGLLQGGPLLGGVLASLPLTERAPLEVSIPGLLSSNNTMLVAQPDLASVQQAVGQLVSSAVSQGVQAPSSISYSSTEAFTDSQWALGLDISASYLGAEVVVSAGYASAANTHTVVAFFEQKMFTVAVPEPERPGDFFQGLTEDEVDQQVAEGHLGPANLPVYVAGVTYGRIMVFSITSAESTQDIEAALNAQYNGTGPNGSLSASYSRLLSDASTTISLLTVGGDAVNAEAAIRTGTPTAFFTSDAAISTGVPISYTLRYLRDNTLATVSETTDYTVRSCQETAAGPGASFYVANADGRVTAYDSSGGLVSLTNPIAISGASLVGIAYDSVADDVLLADAANNLLHVYQPDGASVTQFPAAFPGETPAWGLGYDPKYDRAYIGAHDVIGVATAAGGLFSSVFYGFPSAPALGGIAFDPDNDRIYATDDNASVVVISIGNTTPLTLPGAFPGLSQPRGIVYDPLHRRFYVADTGHNNVLVFSSSGAPVGSAIPVNDPSGLAYDPASDRLYVLDQADAVMRVFRSDGTALPLPPGAFPDMVGPVSIAFRP